MNVCWAQIYALQMQIAIIMLRLVRIRMIALVIRDMLVMGLCARNVCLFPSRLCFRNEAQLWTL
jgi:hypothetical protein